LIKPLLIASFLFVTACATTPPVLSEAPAWEMIPAGVTDLLCSRLQMDALATDTVAVVRVTQPLVTNESVGALKASVASPTSRKAPKGMAQPVNRAIPIQFGQRCAWKPLGAFDARPADEMLVELSAPIVNPVIPSEAGLFARVTLAGEHPAWYWIALVPHGDDWGARRVYVLGR
jgi:hypothetical protein